MTSFASLFSAFPNVEWDRTAISHNSGITPAVFESLDPSHPDWDFAGLSKNLPFDYILSHPELPWVQEALSQNVNVTIQQAIDHPEVAWDRHVFTIFRWRECVENPTFPWEWSLLSLPGGISGLGRASQTELVRRLIPMASDAEWDWNALSTWIPFDIIISNPDKPWDWAVLMQRGSDTQVYGLGSAFYSSIDWLRGVDLPNTML